MIALNDRVRSTLDLQPTSLLVDSLLVLEALGITTDAERQTRAWLCDYLEERHPVLTASLVAWAAGDSPLSYCQTIAAVLRREGIIQP